MKTFTKVGKINIKLTKGTCYDVSTLVFGGFRSESGIAVSFITDGYSYLDWFNSDGEYRGPDEDGIEPTFVVDFCR